jgi:hypothetical protein
MCVGHYQFSVDILEYIVAKRMTILTFHWNGILQLIEEKISKEMI